MEEVCCSFDFSCYSSSYDTGFRERFFYNGLRCREIFITFGRRKERGFKIILSFSSGTVYLSLRIRVSSMTITGQSVLGVSLWVLALWVCKGVFNYIHD